MSAPTNIQHPALDKDIPSKSSGMNIKLWTAVLGGVCLFLVFFYQTVLNREQDWRQVNKSLSRLTAFMHRSNPFSKTTDELLSNSSNQDGGNSQASVAQSITTPSPVPMTPKKVELEVRKLYQVEIISAKTKPGNYSVFGCSTPSGNNYNYAFYLPLTVLAWRAMGYESIVLIAGKMELWTFSPSLNVILETLLDLDCTLIFLDADKANQVMLSQTSRLFVSNLIDFKEEDKTFLVTTDADIWPLNIGMYALTQNTSILSTNGHCCGNFQHRGEVYRMLPMGSIAMSVRTWKEVLGFTNATNSPKTGPGMVHYFEKEFGELAHQPVSKGENPGWFLDQHMISVRVEQWVQAHNARGAVTYLHRDTGRDRVDRTYSWNPERIHGKNDAHLLTDAYNPREWLRTLPLLRKILSAEKVEWAGMYYERFTKSLSYLV